MSAENYKNPKDFDIPENHRPIGLGELWKASEDPQLRQMIRFFADQANDVMSYYIKEGETETEQSFLRQCRRDSRAFRKVLQRKITEAAERYKGDTRVDFILESLACTNRSSADDENGGYLFSVEIRPLYFSSLLEDEEKEGKRYPALESRYTVFLHIDKNHRYQTTRFVEPEMHSPIYQHLMATLLEVFSSEGIIPLLEQHYGDWDFIAERIVAEMVKSMKKAE